MTKTGQAGPKTRMDWVGLARQFEQPVSDNLYGLGRLDDPNRPSGPDDSDKLSCVSLRTQILKNLI